MRSLAIILVLGAAASDATAQDAPKPLPDKDPLADVADDDNQDEPQPADPVAPTPPPEVPPTEEGPPPQPVGPMAEDFGQHGTTRRSHTGLLLRGYTGIGLMTTSADSAGVTTTAGGLATSLGLSAGYSLRPRLAVHFDVVLDVMQNAEIQVDGVAMEPNGAGGLFGVGPGASYYLPSKVNAYVAGSVLLFDRFLSRDEMTFRNTNAGLGFNAVFGKEWWLGGDVGLGLVGQVFLGWTSDKATDDTWSTWAFTLNFSATYN